MAGSLWEASIDSLFINLISPGHIDRGRAGELVTRLLYILARDRFLHETTNIASTRLKYAQPYGVIAFLQSLFRQTKELLDLPAEVIRKKRGGNATVRTSFASASVNFTHFVTTDRTLAPGKVQELLHGLMFS